MDEDGRYEAVRSRDARFDGEFFTAVTTTGIYCRPSCPATTPKRRNVRFYPSAAAAQGAGFRACRRCRPDAVPGSAAWNARADVVGRALRLINDGVIEDEGVAGLAARLGYSARQVQRHLVAEVGAGPLALARAQRAHAARVLLQTTALPTADVAFAAGFASVRQFNDTIREVYAATPTELRAARPAAAKTARGADPGPGGARPGGIPLSLAYRGPYDAAQVFDYLGGRVIAGIEEMLGAPGARVYRRTLDLGHGPGIAQVHEDGERGRLACRLDLADLRDFTSAVGRIRRLFDLDADPYAVAESFAADRLLGPLAAARPGLRAPGAADPHELAFRAVLGQQVTVAAGARLGARLVALHGRPAADPHGGLTRLFPRAADLAGSALDELGMPRSRRATLIALAAALADGSVRLDPGADRSQAERELLAVRGIGPWTAGYIRMRALGDPDVFPAQDVVLKKALDRAGSTAQASTAWRPWRSYAAHHLWASAAGSGAAAR
jgi:AraC family transcriptional regulator, regulatory protein of adaptative response / DNA-3-methyladenine glycosylase II